MKEGWKEKKIGELCEIKGRIGYRGYTKNDLVERGQGAITLSPSNIQNNIFNTDSCTYISWFKYEESPEIMVFEGDILFVKTGSTYGKVAIVDKLNEKATINPQFVVIKNIKCLNKYLFYGMTTSFFKEQVESIVGGTATPTLSQTNLAELKIPVPPLAEQEAIVAKLDEAFTAIDQAKANLERNIANAKELFQSKLNQIFSQKGEDWEEKKLVDITTIINGYAFPSAAFSNSNPIKSIKITNVGVKKFEFTEDSNLPEEMLNEKLDYAAKVGDIVIALTRTIISDGLKVAIVPKEYEKSLINQRVAAIRENGAIKNSLVYYFLSSDLAKQYVLEHVNTLMQPNLSISDLKKMEITFPKSIEKQKEIVEQLDQLAAQTKQLEASYQQKLANLEELRKSILEKAFKGELV